MAKSEPLAFDDDGKLILPSSLPPRQVVVGEVPPRPRNAYILFRNDFFATNRADGLKGTRAQLSAKWHGSPEIRARYKQLAEIELSKHRDMYPDYEYKPSQKFRNQRRSFL
ncbi:slightly ste11-like protein [Paramarasmius palmivorus]|uniref:Slightly ste11-like protein n=1 Tax=Paramarasmius palmivorus TaxID=297713 RepID=A0AAW0D3S3_9AGAR